MEKKKIVIINGPNLNLTGKREKEFYGETSFEDWLPGIRQKFELFDIEYFQSNVEGEIINKLQETGFSAFGIILNAGGYTHTSVAISDAVEAITSPVVEVHMSNILARETYRHLSLIAPKSIGTIAGFGLFSYELGLEYFQRKVIAKS